MRTRYFDKFSQLWIIYVGYFIFFSQDFSYTPCRIFSKEMFRGNWAIAASREIQPLSSYQYYPDEFHSIFDTPFAPSFPPSQLTNHEKIRNFFKNKTLVMTLYWRQTSEPSQSPIKIHYISSEPFESG